MQDKELLAHPWQLLQRALSAARSGEPTLHFGFEPSVYADAISWDWMRERPQAEIQAGQEWKKRLRKLDGEWRRTGRSGLGLDRRDTSSAPPLPDILDRILSDSERIRFHFQDGLEGAGATSQQIAEAETTVRSSPVWRPFLVAEMVRRYLCLTGPPSSDLTDTMHATYLPVVTCFVTADAGQQQVFEETVRWCDLGETKRVLDYGAFRETLVQA